jgi:hypothetical protein
VVWCFVGGTIIQHDVFQVLIALSQYAIDRFREGVTALIGWSDNCDGVPHSVFIKTKMACDIIMINLIIGEGIIAFEQVASSRFALVVEFSGE